MLGFLMGTTDMELESQAQPAAAPPRQFGSYYLQELVNSGGMADIWVASDPDRKTVALRLLRKTTIFDFATKRRFYAGCEILARIHDHDYIIGYVEHGKIEGTPYMAMEYVEGSNLKLLLARQDPVLERHLGNILIDTAVALDHVHESGFTHFDFKPENVLVTGNANVRLIDFDLAQPRDDKPRKMSSYPGTPAYMAPELLLRHEVDHRADVFAFGVTAYELVTGQKPFPGDSPDDILRKELDRSGFLKPRDHNSELPQDLERIILKCLETTPAERYPFMSVVVRDLEKALYV